MSNYTKLVDYAAKDALLSGNPSKLVKGTELGAEFDAVATSIATKYDDTIVHAATGKTTPVDADELPIIDSAASNVLKKLTWANLKATFKAYTDTLYAVLSGGNTFTGTQTVQAAATQDAIKIVGRAGGTSSYAVTLTPTTLSANRTATAPNRDITLDNITTNTTTDLTGVLKGNGTDIDVATAGTDYLDKGTTSTLTAGYIATSYSAGTKSSGTFTPDAANGNFQHYTNGGAHTLAPPSGSCTMIVQITNNGSAGTITTSGFTKVTGTAPGTTNGDDFLGFITVANGFSHLAWQALQ